jgi:hypothetical protein
MFIWWPTAYICNCFRNLIYYTLLEKNHQPDTLETEFPHLHSHCGNMLAHVLDHYRHLYEHLQP